MAILALIRHGQSTWNSEERFTGWTDVPLTSLGKEEARKAAGTINNHHFNLAFCSELLRAKETLNIILEENHLTLPIIYTHAINERDYGDLVGKTHAEVIKEFGKDKYNSWHRSWDSQPPHGESLKDTHTRVMNYFKEQILPELKKGKNVLVVASGNSLRALIKELDGISDKEIPYLEIPTGSASLYEVDSKGKFKKLS